MLLAFYAPLFFFSSKGRACSELSLKIILNGTISNDDFQRNTALQSWNKVACNQNNVSIMLQRYVVLKIVVANRLRVTSP